MRAVETAGKPSADLLCVVAAFSLLDAITLLGRIDLQSISHYSLYSDKN